MMVGPSGSGKTAAWRVLFEAMERTDGVKGDAHVIDPKALSKEALYGSLDPTTLEWTARRNVIAERAPENFECTPMHATHTQLHGTGRSHCRVVCVCAPYPDR